MSKSTSNLGCAAQLGIFAVIVIGGLLLIQALFSLPGNLLGALSASPPTPTTVVLPPVLDLINKQPRLQTVSFFMSSVGDAKQYVGLLQQEQRVILVACGKVTAGIDLSKITTQDIRANGDTATIRLPPAEVFDTLLIEGGDQPCTYVAFRSDGILLDAAKDLETEARRQVVAQFRETALQQGILTQAIENAKTELQRLLFSVGYKNVEFVEP
ncbi:MAG TPA: DUF4230 domain-containing protein [Anaerolineae bacterium]|nr:DUF4230 domain-containing protein [Anaerolineae bacterium]